MKLRYVILGIVIFNVLLIWSLSSAMAQQEEAKPTPIDSYPLPREGGAIRYTLGDKWDRTDLTFFIQNCPATIDCNLAQDAVRNAFAAWDNVSGLTISEVDNPNSADIELQWSVNEEELGRPGDVLAFAYFPSYGGDVFFDDAERWSLYDGGGEDLYVVAVHEIGHSLGLDHSDDLDAVMYAFSGGVSDLGPDDIAGIQRLYGEDDGTAPPPQSDPSVENVPTDGAVETVEGSIDNQDYYETWTIDANAGETITFTMEALSGDLDAYLIIMTPDGETLLAEDDDSLGGTDSQVTYTFPTTDDYVILTTRYDSDQGFSTGDYRLTAYRGSTTAAPPTAIAPTDGVVTITISNLSGVELCELYGSPSSSDEWGENLLDQLGGRLANGGSISLEADVDTYDIYAADCNEGWLQDFYFDISQDSTIEIYADRFELK